MSRESLLHSTVTRKGVRKRIILGVLLAGVHIGVSFAQVDNDSLAEDFRSIAAKNFSRYRTVNFSWETKLSHDYNFAVDGNKIEKGRKRDIHTINFSTMVPLVKAHKASLYANVKYTSYNFDNKGSQPSVIFMDDTYDYYAGGLNGSYYLSLFNRPLILSAEVFVDGWKKGWGEVQGRFSTVMVLKNTKQTNFSVGLMGMTLYNSTPIMPIITYWHRFGNPNLSLDITLPSQMYLRYQMRHQRISLGASMNSDNFYLNTDLHGSPTVCLYAEAVVKPEIHYEYIISRQFYLSAHAGFSTLIKGGLYNKNRKELKCSDAEKQDGNEAFVKLNHSLVPFFNVGVSYSLFK